MADQKERNLKLLLCCGGLDLVKIFSNPVSKSSFTICIFICPSSAIKSTERKHDEHDEHDERDRRLTNFGTVLGCNINSESQGPRFNTLSTRTRSLPQCSVPLDIEHGSIKLGFPVGNIKN